MKIGTIYYLIDDIFSPKLSLSGALRNLRRRTFFKYLYRCFAGYKRAVGGIKMDYVHCMLLREAGYDAKPLLVGKVSGNVFGLDIDEVRVEDVGYDLKENDIVVCNEFFPYSALMFNNCKKVVFVQAWSTIYKRIEPKDKGKNYLDLGHDHVMCCSQFTTQYIREHMGIEAATVTNGIDPKVFYPDAAVRQENRVLCLPRKNKQDIDRIREIVERRCPDAEFVEVNNLTERELAEEYRKSDIFLATGYPEGFALPPLEGMASGCAVVGFTGGGASEYMIDGKTALVADDGDCETAADKLVKLLTDADYKETVRANGIQTAKSYTLHETQKQLVRFVEDLAARDTRPTTDKTASTQYSNASSGQI